MSFAPCPMTDFTRRLLSRSPAFTVFITASYVERSTPPFFFLPLWQLTQALESKGITSSLKEGVLSSFLSSVFLASSARFDPANPVNVEQQIARVPAANKTNPQRKRIPYLPIREKRQEAQTVNYALNTRRS